jgi:hypothetical protein
MEPSTQTSGRKELAFCWLNVTALLAFIGLLLYQFTRQATVVTPHIPARVDLTVTPLASIDQGRFTGAILDRVGTAQLVTGYRDEQIFAIIHGRERPATPAILAAFMRQLYASDRTLPAEITGTARVSCNLHSSTQAWLAVDGEKVTLPVGLMLPRTNRPYFTSPTTFFLGGWRAQAPTWAKVKRGRTLELVRIDVRLRSEKRAQAPQALDHGSLQGLAVLLLLIGGLVACVRWRRPWLPFGLLFPAAYYGIGSQLIHATYHWHWLPIIAIGVMALGVQPRYRLHAGWLCCVLFGAGLLLSFTYARVLHLPGYAPAGAREKAMKYGHVRYWHTPLTGLRGADYPELLQLRMQAPIVNGATWDAPREQASGASQEDEAEKPRQEHP